LHKLPQLAVYATRITGFHRIIDIQITYISPIMAAAAVVVVNSWLAVVGPLVALVDSSLVAAVRHSSLVAAVRHSSLVAAVRHSSLVAAVRHSSPVAAVGHSSFVAVVRYSSPVEVEHSSFVAVDFVVHQASNSAPECPADHWDWLVAADNRYYYSRPDLP
jgi:hypothetical protein